MEAPPLDGVPPGHGAGSCPSPEANTHPSLTVVDVGPGSRQAMMLMMGMMMMLAW